MLAIVIGTCFAYRLGPSSLTVQLEMVTMYSTSVTIYLTPYSHFVYEFLCKFVFQFVLSLGPPTKKCRFFRIYFSLAHDLSDLRLTVCTIYVWFGFAVGTTQTLLFMTMVYLSRDKIQEISFPIDAFSFVQYFFRTGTGFYFGMVWGQGMIKIYLLKGWFTIYFLWPGSNLFTVAGRFS